MTHHKKIGKWLQLGGHADGESNLFLVAKREVNEESGLTKFHAMSEEIFDLDIHTIPALNSEPAHIHYDVRFLFEASSESEKITVSNESLDVAWVPIENVVKLNPEKSMSRMIKKTKLLKR
jgi:8-oxo-dGTP pyrophosphatase MutT (NUDIX family)